MRILLAMLLLLAACRAPAEKRESVPVVRMATVLGRVMTPLSEALNKVLPDHFPARLEIERAKTTENYVEMLEAGQIELAMIQTDVAYQAYTRGVGDSTRPQHKLRGVAVLYTIPIHLLATKKSGIRSITDLGGKRVFVGTGHNPAEYAVKMTLEGAGLSPGEIHAVTMPTETVVSALRSGQLDAAFVRSNDPSPATQAMMDVPGVSFIPITQIERIQAHHPFLHSTSIQAGIYGDHPEIETVGVDMLLACRDDLSEELVYWITRTLFESLPALADSLKAIRQIDFEHIQASPIPLHPGAGRFYRGRELFP